MAASNGQFVTISLLLTAAAQYSYALISADPSFTFPLTTYVLSPSRAVKPRSLPFQKKDGHHRSISSTSLTLHAYRKATEREADDPLSPKPPPTESKPKKKNKYANYSKTENLSMDPLEALLNESRTKLRELHEETATSQSSPKKRQRNKKILSELTSLEAVDELLAAVGGDDKYGKDEDEVEDSVNFEKRVRNKRHFPDTTTIDPYDPTTYGYVELGEFPYCNNSIPTPFKQTIFLSKQQLILMNATLTERRNKFPLHYLNKNDNLPKEPLSEHTESMAFSNFPPSPTSPKNDFVNREPDTSNPPTVDLLAKSNWQRGGPFVPTLPLLDPMPTPFT